MISQKCKRKTDGPTDRRTKRGGYIYIKKSKSGEDTKAFWRTDMK